MAAMSEWWTANGNGDTGGHVQQLVTIILHKLWLYLYVVQIICVHYNVYQCISLDIVQSSNVHRQI